jgi:hypothetical protein
MPVLDRSKPNCLVTFWYIEDQSPAAIEEHLNTPGFVADTSHAGPVLWYPQERQAIALWKHAFVMCVPSFTRTIDMNQCPYNWYQLNAVDTWVHEQRSKPLPATVIQLTLEDGSSEYYGVGNFILPLTLPDGRIIQAIKTPHVPWVQPME